MQRVGEVPALGRRVLGRVVLGGLALALAAAGCTFDSRSGDEASVTPSGPVVDGGVNMTGRAPLTGVPSKNALNRPAITVKISNTRDAHPHRGLAEADLVF